VDYPDQSTCGTSGSQGCLCQQCEPVLIPDSPLCQVTPVCVKNEDCGESSFNDSSSYCKDNKVYKKRTYYNKECLSGSCFSSTSVEEIKVSECSFGCLNGGCIFECSKNSDCGINRYSDPYCLNNDAYHLVFNYSCTYGKCIKNVSEEFVKDCGNDEITPWKPECDGNNLWNVREKIGNGCLDGFCFHKSDFQKQYLDYCDFGCENGACLNSSCPL